MNYLYYCKNCNTLETDTEKNARLRCGDCGGKYYPLRVTEDDWDKYGVDKKKQILLDSISQKDNLNQSSYNNTSPTPVNTGKLGIAISLVVVFIIIGLIVHYKNDSKKSYYSDYSYLSSKTYDSKDYGYDYNYSYSKDSATDAARSYLNSSHFSRTGLIDQLEYEGFSTTEATRAVDNCGADWKYQAKESAKGYLKTSAFSYKGLIEQLEYEGFTSDEATYGVDNCGADWNEQAVKSAKSYLKTHSFSKYDLIDQLKYEGFTREQAEYGVQKNGL